MIDRPETRSLRYKPEEQRTVVLERKSETDRRKLTYLNSYFFSTAKYIFQGDKKKKSPWVGGGAFCKKSSGKTVVKIGGIKAGGTKQKTEGNIGEFQRRVTVPSRVPRSGPRRATV